jgi:hypothetical protein
MGLAREATIERQIETLSSESVAALNLGVPGYGPEDALEHYRERAGAAAGHVFFLLYGNDLRLDNCRAAFHTAVDGVIVRRERADGRPARAGELRRRLAERRARGAPDPSAGLRGAALLERLRARLEALRDPESQLLAGAPGEFSEACARRAAGAAAAMRALARAHGQRFSVVVLPTAGEAARQRYAAPMRAALAELGRLEVPTLEVRPLLSPGDYLSGDEHLAPSGARKVARAILEAARGAG